VQINPFKKARGTLWIRLGSGEKKTIVWLKSKGGGNDLLWLSLGGLEKKTSLARDRVETAWKMREALLIPERVEQPVSRGGVGSERGGGKVRAGRGGSKFQNQKKG